MHIQIDQIKDEQDLFAVLRDPRPLELGERGIEGLLEILPGLVRQLNGRCGTFADGDLADKAGKCRSP